MEGKKGRRRRQGGGVGFMVLYLNLDQIKSYFANVRHMI